MEINSKIILGTAQFGFAYGINNKQGKISNKEIFKILNYAWDNKIRLLDTAYSYGNSEQIIGNFIHKTGKKFNLISKLPVCPQEKIDDYLKKSLKKLKTASLYGYLFHNFRSYLKDRKTLNVLQKFKKRGVIKNVGFSLYYPQELEYLLTNNIDFDILQIPYSVFDQRFTKFFPKLKIKGLKIFARSVFLQGLIFKKPNELTRQFNPLKNKLNHFSQLAIKNNLSFASLALNFVLLNKNIDKVLIGIDNLSNLKKNLESAKDKYKIIKLYNKLLRLAVTDEKIILPICWPKKEKHGKITKTLSKG